MRRSLSLVAPWLGLALLSGLFAPGRAVSDSPTWSGAASRVAITNPAGHFENLYFSAFLAREVQGVPNLSDRDWQDRCRPHLDVAGLTTCEFPQANGPQVLTDTQCFVASNERLVVIAFRGTELKARDIITDARFATTDYDELSSFGHMRVHRGFRDGLNAVWPELLAAVRRQRPPGSNKPIWITGHSLGGALATLAGIRLSYELGGAEQPGTDIRPEIVVYTFGAPRVGDHAFCLAFDDRVPLCYRMVYNRDIVPMVPPASLPLTQIRYDHVEQEYYYDQTFHQVMHPALVPAGNLRGFFGEFGFDNAANVIESDLRLEKRLSLEQREALFSPSGPFSDHRLANYLQAAYRSLPDGLRGAWPAP